MLRQFLYLNRSLVRDFIAQLEGGVFDESREQTTTERKRGANARLGARNLGARVERTKGHQALSDAVIKQTAASEFDRLYAALEQERMPVFDVVDEKPEDLALRRKEIIEIDVRLRVSGMETLREMIGAFSRLAPMLEQLGVADVDHETVEAMKAMSTLTATERLLPVIGVIPGECGLSVAMELESEWATTDRWDTDATVLLKVQRILRPGDRQVVGDVFGGLMNLISEVDRDKLLSGLRELDGKLPIGEMEVHYPALVGTAIAIYR